MGQGVTLAMKKEGILHELKRNRTLFLMILPAVLIVLVFSYTPLNGLVLAFKDFRYAKGIWGSPWNGF